MDARHFHRQEITFWGLKMATIIIGIGIGIVIVALAIEPEKIAQYRRYAVPMGALAGILMAIVLLAQ